MDVGMVYILPRRGLTTLSNVYPRTLCREDLRLLCSFGSVGIGYHHQVIIHSRRQKALHYLNIGRQFILAVEVSPNVVKAPGEAPEGVLNPH